MAYIYKHIRLDKNEPFYIGIGFDNTGKYRRAHEYGRNDIWGKIVKKTNYIVEIIEDGLSNEDVIEREKYWIKLFGRINNNTGILSNLTDGGQGSVGWIPTNETRLKISKSKTGKPHTEEAKKKFRGCQKGKKVSEYTKQKISQANKGNTHTEDAKKKMSEAKMGKSLKESTKEKMSKVAKGKKKPICKCPNCDKVGGIPQMKRWHFENCKSKSIFNSTRIYENFFVY